MEPAGSAPAPATAPGSPTAPAPDAGPASEILAGRLHLFGFPDVPAQVRVVRHAPGARTGRALKALGACWGLAVVSVLVPIAHFVLVPGFIVVGIVLAAQRMGETASVLGVRGRCPRCDAEREFIAAGRLRAEGRVQCPQCRNELSLEVDPKDVKGEPPASGG